MVDLATATHIQNQLNNLSSIPWFMVYRAYVTVWQTGRGLDFAAFPLPCEPAVDLPDDFGEWVDQMEGDYLDSFQAQFTGIYMF